MTKHDSLFGLSVWAYSYLCCTKAVLFCQIETPLFRSANLLWGVDYDNEEDFAPFDIIDSVDFEASGGQVFRKIDERIFIPLYELSQLGLFAQLQWDISDRFLLSGGVRHQRIGVSVDDYTSFIGDLIAGGDLDFNSTVFNVGTVYKITDELSLFTSFSQGFSVPDLSEVFAVPPAGFSSVEVGIEDLEPQKVDNYEIGIRGNWQSVQASLSAYYNYSDLGETFVGSGVAARAIINFLAVFLTPIGLPPEVER